MLACVRCNGCGGETIENHISVRGASCEFVFAVLRLNNSAFNGPGAESEISVVVAWKN